MGCNVIERSEAILQRLSLSVGPLMFLMMQGIYMKEQVKERPDCRYVVQESIACMTLLVTLSCIACWLERFLMHHFTQILINLAVPMESAWPLL